jgi:ribonuclease HII
MTQWDKVFPEYGLADNKGYSAPQHLEALERYGPTPLHRLSFEPARAASLFPVSTEPWNEDQLNLFSPGVECL